MDDVFLWSLTGAPATQQDFLVKSLLEGIPPLSERVKLLREREIARRGGAVETDAKSQSECAHRAAPLSLARWAPLC